MIISTNNRHINLEKLNQCQIILGYTFKDISLLEKSLTHTSCRYENNLSNERLEFLGDAILGMIVSEYLYKTLPKCTEGELTKIKSVIVSQATLARISLEARLKDFLLVGKGLSEQDFFPKSLLANVFEAIIAAIYIDGGFEPAYNFTIRFLKNEIDVVCKNQHDKNYKSILQQYTQKNLGVIPIYRVLQQTGPDHEKSFEVVVIINGIDYCTGWGKSKKEAEQLAAKETLKILSPDLIHQKNR